jgi:dolichol-phosphate mannosyltransferase
MDMHVPVSVSIIIPVKNEKDNVGLLVDEIVKAFAGTKCIYEVIFVDDHSDDGTGKTLREIGAINKTIRYLALDKLQGKDAALVCGFSHATGSLIATLDGDLQNDPADLLEMIDLCTDVDMVCGVRQNRKDRRIRRISSFIANSFRNWFLEMHDSDAGCAIRVFKRQCVEEFKKNWTKLNGFAHCFFPAMVRLSGRIVMEKKVKDRPRTHGTSKFGNMLRDVPVSLRACFSMRKLIQREQHGNGIALK